MNETMRNLHRKGQGSQTPQGRQGENGSQNTPYLKQKRHASY